jgi:hypothetical protein
MKNRGDVSQPAMTTTAAIRTSGMMNDSTMTHARRRRLSVPMATSARKGIAPTSASEPNPAASPRSVSITNSSDTGWKPVPARTYAVPTTRSNWIAVGP